MFPIANEYIEQYGTEAGAVSAFVDDLMRGDPENFKAGYSLDNAVIATAEAFGITQDEVRYHVS